MYSSLLALALNSATAADNTSCHKLDVMLMFDTTSSMYSLLRNAKFHASEIVSVVEDKDSSARYALAYLQEHPGENNQYDIPFQLVSDLSESPFITSNLIKKFEQLTKSLPPATFVLLHLIQAQLSIIYA